MVLPAPRRASNSVIADSSADRSAFLVGIGVTFEIDFALLNVPALKQLRDDCKGKARTHQPPNHPRGLLLILRLFQTLASDVAPHQLVFAHLRISALDCACGRLRLNTFAGKLLLHA